MQVERETQDKIAHKNFLSYLNKHRLHSEYREWHSVNLNLKIIQCCLLDNKNRTIAVGMGKGTKKAPILGSEFEAIEHYIFGKQKHNIENKKIEDIVSQAPVMLNESVIKIILNKYKDISFNTTRFKAFNSHDYIDYPTILIDINWKEPEIDDNSRIYSYASDSGYASGSTENEAYIHAINELVERDTVSKFMIQYGLNYNLGIDAKIIQYQSLPKRLKKIYADIKESIDGKLSLIKVSNKYGIPTYISIIDEYDYPLYGFGTSLIEDYAVERALTEAFQLYCVYNEEDRIMFSRISEIWKDMPDILKIIKFEFIRDLQLGNYEPVNDQPYFMNVHENLQELLLKLNKDNIHVYKRQVYKADGIAVVQVLIPQFDKFNLILEGQVVIPNI